MLAAVEHDAPVRDLDHGRGCLLGRRNMAGRAYQLFEGEHVAVGPRFVGAAGAFLAGPHRSCATRTRPPTPGTCCTRR
jgi:hypothetical protein